MNEKHKTLQRRIYMYRSRMAILFASDTAKVCLSTKLVDKEEEEVLFDPRVDSVRIVQNSLSEENKLA